MLVHSMTWNVCDFKRARGNEFPSKEPSSLLNKDYILYTHTHIYIYSIVLYIFFRPQNRMKSQRQRVRSPARLLCPGRNANVDGRCPSLITLFFPSFWPHDAFARQSRLTPLLRGSVSLARRPHKNNRSFRKSHESEKSTAPRRIWLSPAALFRTSVYRAVRARRWSARTDEYPFK